MQPMLSWSERLELLHSTCMTAVVLELPQLPAYLCRPCTLIDRLDVLGILTRTPIRINLFRGGRKCDWALVVFFFLLLILTPVAYAHRTGRGRHIICLSTTLHGFFVSYLSLLFTTTHGTLEPSSRLGACILGEINFLGLTLKLRLVNLETLKAYKCWTKITRTEWFKLWLGCIVLLAIGAKRYFWFVILV